MAASEGDLVSKDGTAALKAEFVLEAKVAIGETLVIGKSKYGDRRVVPITGGTFEGPRVRGEVIPGGADWQLFRADGDIEVEARYTLRASDGALIHIRNRGLVHIPQGTTDLGKIYVRTVPEFEAASDGPHAWLNHGIFLGTLRLAGGGVEIRVYHVG
jgi:hypothetical protein